MNLTRYILMVSGVAAVSLPLAWALVPRRLEAADRWATLYGGTLAVLNAVWSYGLVLWSDRRPTGAFLKAVLWGTLARMAVLLAAVAAGILAFDLPRVPLVVALLAYFLLFLLVQITILHRRAPTAPGDAL